MGIKDDIARQLSVATGNQVVAQALADKLMGIASNTTGLTSLTTPGNTDAVVVVDDPTGTPTLKQTTPVGLVKGGAGVHAERYIFDCSAGGQDKVEDVVTVPLGDILLDVIAVVDTPFDGVDNSCEVGVSGNYDKYIDSTDFDPSTDNDTQAMTGGGSNDQGSPEYMASATTIKIQWTNGDFTVFTGTGTGTGDDTDTGTGTNNVTAGQVSVYVLSVTPSNG